MEATISCTLTILADHSSADPRTTSSTTVTIRHFPKGGAPSTNKEPNVPAEQSEEKDG